MDLNFSITLQTGFKMKKIHKEKWSKVDNKKI